MSEVINEDNIDEYRRKLKSNYHDSIKSSILNLIESGYSYLLENDKITKDMLDDMTSHITDDEEFNNYLDGMIIDEIENCIKEYQIEEEEEL